MIFRILYWAFPLVVNAVCLGFCWKLWKEKKRGGAVALMLFALVCFAHPILTNPYK